MIEMVAPVVEKLDETIGNIYWFDDGQDPENYDDWFLFRFMGDTAYHHERETDEETENVQDVFLDFVLLMIDE